MALTVPRFISTEVVKLLVSAFRYRSVIAVVRIVAVIHVAPEAVRAVEPRSGSDEHAAHEPIGPIVAVGSAVIRRVVEVPIGADWRHANIDADSNLGWPYRRAAEQGDCKS
jgi:hypothetical protein